MGCFDECLNGIMEPYGGNMPLFNSSDTTDATVTIVQESYDDGMKVTRIQTPPRTNTKTLIEAIDNVLGFMGSSCLSDMMSETSPTTEECDEDKSDKKKKPGKDFNKGGEKNDNLHAEEEEPEDTVYSE